MTPSSVHHGINNSNSISNSGSDFGRPRLLQQLDAHVRTELGRLQLLYRDNVVAAADSGSRGRSYSDHSGNTGLNGRNKSSGGRSASGRGGRSGRTKPENQSADADDDDHEEEDEQIYDDEEEDDDEPIDGSGMGRRGAELRRRESDAAAESTVRLQLFKGAMQLFKQEFAVYAPFLTRVQVCDIIILSFSFVLWCRHAWYFTFSFTLPPRKQS
jgi:hypothetical protein